MPGPLSDVVVVDLSRILAGPWASQVLADYGATVWKVERPGQGDDTRKWGPPYLQDQQGNDTAESAYYLAANRGKHSVEIDIASAEGQATVRQMVAKADIVIENFKVGTLAKYGLDYASLKAINPSIILCSITGFGQYGPDAHKPGYDAMIQAAGGLMSITGEPDELGGGPQKVGVAVTDLMTGMYAVSGILAALHHRNATGEGQHIDLALMDTQVAYLANQGSNYLVGGKVPQRLGNAHPNIVPYQSFKVADGHIMLAVGNDAQFQRCAKVLGLEHLAEQADFATNDARVANRADLVPQLQQVFMTQGLDHWMAQLQQAKVPCGPINTLDRVFDQPQVKHREMTVELEHSSGAKAPLVANPVKFSETQIEYNKAPPSLGEDNSKLKAWLSTKTN
ncbi:CaiB/BaiF CoA transferase family protein [Paraferrimonas sedimenticola]|uniref:CoA transferase n=1 Tax=Paraferrimonas sedimenticola TaxID=375674 RepID=A0AA37RVX5_9GAMM|nr:CaiB/BaiF CoA-transferase family protein [Paraferrimonas sedimenticola]GLP96315.1 CoA transferase [Paraferrimonas sedimenticola]